MERIIDTFDGDILVKTACDYESGASYLEFYERDGYDEEGFPWKYIGESGLVGGDPDEMTYDELAELYYEVSSY